MKHLTKALVVIALGILIILAQSHEQNKTQETAPEISALVELIRVVDGDTIVVKLNGDDEKIRIIGIDTPESVKPHSPVECFAKEATEHIGELLNTGENVKIETDPTQDTRDTYGRLLAHVFVGDINIGQHMIQDGYAYEYTYDNTYKYQGVYRDAQSEARRAQQGLWSPETCSGRR